MCDGVCECELQVDLNGDGVDVCGNPTCLLYAKCSPDFVPKLGECE